MKIKNKSLINNILKIIISLFICLSLIILIILCSVYMDEYKVCCALLSFCSIGLPFFLGWLMHSVLDLKDKELWQKSLNQNLKKGNIKKDDFVRISFAYLFRIIVDGKYLLLKNRRGTGNFQPVGGCYKFNEDEKKILKTKYGIVDDKCIPIDESSKNDYRMRVSVKYLKKFVKQFDKTKNRENINDLSREFQEELINTKILDKENFTELKYRYCGRHYTNIEYSKYFGCYELLLADIIELEISDKQEEELRNLIYNNRSNTYYWATEDEIKSNGIITGTQHMDKFISDHTEKILECNADNLLEMQNIDKSYMVKLN